MFIVNDQTFTGYSDISLDLVYVLAILFGTLVIISKNPIVPILIFVEVIFMIVTNILVRIPLKEYIWSINLELTWCLLLILILNIVITIFIYKIFNNLSYKFCLIATIFVILNPIIIDYSFVFMTNLSILDLRILNQNLLQEYRRSLIEAQGIRYKIHRVNTMINSLDNYSLPLDSDARWLAENSNQINEYYTNKHEVAIHNAQFFKHHWSLLYGYLLKKHPISYL